MAIANFADAEIYYEISGEGHPLVLIPGFASGAWSWAWQVGSFSDRFRVITFDPRGVSRSTLSDGADVSIEAIADDVANLLDAIGLDSADVLGISFGGFVAQEFALKHPQRLGKLVLASTSFGGPNHIPPSAEVLAAFTATDGLNTSERIGQYLTLAFSREYAAANGPAVERFCRLREENVVPRDVYMRQLQSAMDFDAEDRIRKIAARTLVITGDDDTVVPPQNSRNLAAAIPNAGLKVIEGSGHMAFVEKAAEFNRIVREFLQS